MEVEIFYWLGNMSTVSVRTAEVRQTMGLMNTHTPPGSHQNPIFAEENRQRLTNATSHQSHLRQPIQYEQTATLSSKLTSESRQFRISNWT